MTSLFLLHFSLLTSLGGVFFVYFRKKIRIEILSSLLICVCLAVFANSILSNNTLIENAFMNVLIYGLFIKWSFHKNIIDSLYLSMSYWISIEIVDLVLQYLKLLNILNGPHYLIMIVLIVIAFIPYLMMQNVEKKFIVFVLPVVLCLFMVQVLENEKLFNHTFILILMGLFISNICYLYFFSFTIKNIQLSKEKESLNRQIHFISDNYNRTFYFLHDLMHVNHSIRLNLQNKDYDKAQENFDSMNSKIVKQFNSIYSGNTALSAAICSIDCKNLDVQHIVLCNLDEFDENDLTLFFINVLSKIVDRHIDRLLITVKSVGSTKIIQFKTSTNFDFKCIENETKKFIKKYKLKVQIEDKSITFLRLNAK